MKISALETVRLGEFPNLVWVRVHTDEGLVGLGETFFGAAEVEAWLHATAAPLLLGQDPLRIDKHSRTLLNPYLGFAAMLMAGLDGIKNKIDPGSAIDKDLYDLPKEELKSIPTVCGSLREALENLDKDRAFLKHGGVFDDDFIDSYIELKMTEVARFDMTPHPVEFDMYYSL